MTTNQQQVTGRQFVQASACEDGSHALTNHTNHRTITKQHKTHNRSVTLVSFGHTIHSYSVDTRGKKESSKDEEDDKQEDDKEEAALKDDPVVALCAVAVGAFCLASDGGDEGDGGKGNGHQPTHIAVMCALLLAHTMHACTFDAHTTYPHLLTYTHIHPTTCTHARNRRSNVI